MVKVCLEDFPEKGGFYMDGILKDNLDVMAKRIVDDMMFNLLITGDGQVRVGKSVMAMQIGKYLTTQINTIHKLKNPFGVDNMVFKADELIDKAHALPPYSVIILDEGDDLTENYWSALAKKLRRFFRKCGQLNLIFIMLIPDFFELSRPYAITRTTALINTYFYGEFERGFFNFYSFGRKRELYNRGKKYGNYKAVKENFSGRFTNFYPIDEKVYREKKRNDLESDNDEEEEGISLTGKKYMGITAVLFELMIQNGWTQQKITDYLTSRGFKFDRQRVSYIMKKAPVSAQVHTRNL